MEEFLRVVHVSTSFSKLGVMVKENIGQEQAVDN